MWLMATPAFALTFTTVAAPGVTVFTTASTTGSAPQTRNMSVPGSADTPGGSRLPPLEPQPVAEAVTTAWLATLLLMVPGSELLASQPWMLRCGWKDTGGPLRVLLIWSRGRVLEQPR